MSWFVTIELVRAPQRLGGRLCTPGGSDLPCLYRGAARQREVRDESAFFVCTYLFPRNPPRTHL